MNFLMAIVLLCQVTGSTNPTGSAYKAYYEMAKADQRACQNYYVNCWNKKRKEQLAEAASC